MVEIVALDEEEFSPSDDRRLDAEEIEALASKHASRPTVKVALESLAKKLRKESEALKRVEQSRKKEQQQQQAENQTEKQSDPPPEVEEKPQETPQEEPPTETTKPQTTPPKTEEATPHQVLPTAKYVPIDKFAFDSGGYNSPTVTIYVSLPSVGSIDRDLITCDFSPSSFDLIVRNLDSKSYRLFKDNLSHDVEPSKCKCIVKANKVILKLAKIKGEYGYENWTDLVEKKKQNRRRNAEGKLQKEDPQQSIMNLMKDMYDSGDDNMRKIIGETMMKQREGTLGKDPGADMDMGM